MRRRTWVSLRWITRLSLLAGLALATSGVARAVPGSTSSDGVWRELRVSEIIVPESGFSLLSSYRVYNLDGAVLAPILDRAPDFGTPGSVVLTLPVGAAFERFEIHESPFFSPQLAAQHPGVHSFVAQGLDNPRLTATFVQSPSGFFAFIRTPEGMLFMEPTGPGNMGQCVAYRRVDLTEQPQFDCGVVPEGGDRTPDTEQVPGGDLIPNVAPSGATLSTYDLAVTTTGEFTQFFDPGGGATNTFANVVASVAAVNAIYIPELTIRMQLVCAAMYLDPATDVFTAADNSGTSIGQNQPSTDALCGGSAGYDIGHVFHRRASGFSGLAGGSTCNNADKAMGYSSVPNPVPGTMIWVVDQLAHEMGHQCGAAHTFNSDVTGCSGNRVGSSAYEPGSGSTIMAYAAAARCDFDFPGSNDAYFHGHSFDQITTYRDGGGNCGTNTATGNTPPTVDAGASYTIPQGTPFTLTASGSDADGHPITYCWEQFDLGSPGDLPTNVNGPLFRTYPPVSSPARTFPQLSDILAGNPTPTEMLPLVNRTLNWRCTVRDNRMIGGGVNNDGMVLTISGAPFAVTAPNGGETLHADCLTTVTWTVGGSVATHVNILLSTNGGTTFSTLAGNVTNDGSHEVRLPCTTTSQGRVRVEPVGNIYFDISNSNFTITNDDPVASMDATGGNVGATCEFVVPFTATLTDDCRLDATTVQVTASSLDGNATVDAPIAVVNVIGVDEIEVTGTVRVSALTDCPALVRVRIEVEDECGLSDVAFEDVEVIDDTAPEITVTLSPTQLWPPNHTLRTITAVVPVTDNCSGVSYVLESVTSSEPENDLGDGNTAPDIVGASLGTPDLQFQLRAERQGPGSGRVYTVTYTASDPCGNNASASAEVLVPHSKSANAQAAAGLTLEGDQFDPEGTVVAFVVTGASLVPAMAEDLPGEILPVDGIERGPAVPQESRSRIVTLMEAGNGFGVLRARRIEPLDADHDGIEDYLVTFSAAALRHLADESGEPIALHVVVDGTESFEMPSMLGMGPMQPFLPEVQTFIDRVLDLEVVEADLTHRDPTPTPAGAPGEVEMARRPTADSRIGTGFRGVQPNPFFGSTTFAFELASGGAVTLAVFTPSGRAVRVIENAMLPAGRHSRMWDGRDAEGRAMAAGVYIVRLSTKGFDHSVKAVLVR